MAKPYPQGKRLSQNDFDNASSPGNIPVMNAAGKLDDSMIDKAGSIDKNDPLPARADRVAEAIENKTLNIGRESVLLNNHALISGNPQALTLSANLGDLSQYDAFLFKINLRTAGGGVDSIPGFNDGNDIYQFVLKSAMGFTDENDAHIVLASGSFNTQWRGSYDGQQRPTFVAVSADISGTVIAARITIDIDARDYRNNRLDVSTLANVRARAFGAGTISVYGIHLKSPDQNNLPPTATLLTLPDTPQAWGNAGQMLVVNNARTGLVFRNIPNLQPAPVSAEAPLIGDGTKANKLRLNAQAQRRLIPGGGMPNQVLVRTAGGYEWADYTPSAGGGGGSGGIITDIETNRYEIAAQAAQSLTISASDNPVFHNIKAFTADAEIDSIERTAQGLNILKKGVYQFKLKLHFDLRTAMAGEWGIEIIHERNGERQEMWELSQHTDAITQGSDEDFIETLVTQLTEMEVGDKVYAAISYNGDRVGDTLSFNIINDVNDDSYLSVVKILTDAGHAASPRTIKDIINTARDFSATFWQQQNDAIPSPQFTYASQIGNSVKQLLFSITRRRFSIDNETNRTMSFEYTQIAGGEADAGKVQVNFGSNITLADLWELGDIKTLVITKGDDYEKEIELTDTQTPNSVVFSGTAFDDAAAETADPQSALLWKKQSNVVAGEYQVNFKNSNGDLLFKRDGQYEPKRFGRSNFVALVTSIVNTAVGTAINAVAFANGSFTFTKTNATTTVINITNWVRGLISSITENNFSVDVALSTALTFSQANQDFQTGNAQSNVNKQFTLNGYTFTLRRIVDDDSGDIILLFSDFTDSAFTELRKWRFRIFDDGATYKFKDYTLLPASGGATREITFTRTGGRVQTGIKTFKIFKYPWDRDDIAPLIELHNGAITALNITALNGAKVAISGIGSGDFRISAVQNHGFLRGEIEITKLRSNLAGTDFGGDDLSGTISINMPLDRIARSDVIDTVASNYGAKISGGLSIYNGNTVLGAISAYIGRQSDGSLRITLVYTPAHGNNVNNTFETSARLQLEFESLGVAFSRALASGRIFSYPTTADRPAIDSSWGVEELGTPYAFIETTEEIYRGVATHTDVGVTDVGYNATPVVLETADFIAGVSGSKTYKGVNKNINRNYNGVGVPSGGTLSTRNDNLLGFMLTYDTNGGGNGQLEMLFVSNRAYMGTITVQASGLNSTIIQLTRESATVWKSGNLGSFQTNILETATEWSITATTPAGVMRTTVYSWELFMKNFPFENITQAAFDAKKTASTLENGKYYFIDE